jgi:hypothetical protein
LKLVFGAACVLVFFFVDAYLDRRRRRSFTRFAVLQNLQYAPEDPFGLLGEPFASLARGDDGTVENVLWGTWHETPLVVFDYRYSRRRGWVGMMPGGRSFSCAVTSVEAACKRLAIERPSLRTRLADGLGLADIRFESEAFNGAFNVKGDDERFASAFVDARMMEWLLNEAGAFGFEVAGDRLLVVCDRRRPMELVPLLAKARDFRKQVPPVVFSLYPKSG